MIKAILLDLESRFLLVSLGNIQFSFIKILKIQKQDVFVKHKSPLVTTKSKPAFLSIKVKIIGALTLAPYNMVYKFSMHATFLMVQK